MTYIDVLKAIAGRVVSLWPGRMSYRDFCPADHKHPFRFLCVERTEMEDVSLGLMQWSLETRLELYAATDECSVEDTEQLRADQAAVLGQFDDPAPAVGDWHVQVNAATDTPGPGVAYVILSVQWMDTQPGYQDPRVADTPEMKHFATERTAL